MSDLPGILPPRSPMEAVLDRLQAMPPEPFKRKLLEAALHDSTTVDAVMGGQALAAALKAIPRAKRDWLQFMGLYPPLADSSAQRAIELLLRRPAAVRDAAVETAKRFWQEAFRQTWENLVPPFSQSLARARAMVKSGAWDELPRLGLNVELDREAGALKALRGGYQLPLDQAQSIYLLPSAFNERKFWTVIEGRGGHQVAYLPFLDRTLSPDPEPFRQQREAEIDIALVFRALGDATRFAMASLIARGPVSATDLAHTLGLSKPTISHHLHELREAGLIEEKDAGKSVLLALNRGTIASLSELALDRLQSPAAVIPMAHARRHRGQR